MSQGASPSAMGAKYPTGRIRSRGYSRFSGVLTSFEGCIDGLCINPGGVGERGRAIQLPRPSFIVRVAAASSLTRVGPRTNLRGPASGPAGASASIPTGGQAVATPFRDKPFTFTQPDGTKLQVRGTGDQHYAVFETLDGFTVVKNPTTGFYEVARLSADGGRLEPAGVAPTNVAAARAIVPFGLRVDREAARARGLEAVRRLGGRRCDEPPRAAPGRGPRRRRRAGSPRPPAPDRRGLRRPVPADRLSDEPGRSPATRSTTSATSRATRASATTVRPRLLPANSVDRCRYTNIVARTTGPCTPRRTTRTRTSSRGCGPGSSSSRP